MMKVLDFKKGLFVLLMVMGIVRTSSAQVGVGITTPDASAQLQIESTDKGLLIPRVTSTGNVTAPATGLMVYQTNSPAGFYYNSGTSGTPVWLKIATGSTGIADSSVTNVKIAPNAAIAYSKLALTNSIVSGDIMANAVISSKVATGTITTSKLADSAVTNLKLGKNAVNNSHIPDGMILPAKLNATGATTGQVLTFNGSNASWSAAASGGSAESMFSASLSTFPVVSSTQISGWNVTSPNFSGQNFNSATGNFTVPETGKYQISAIMNYSTLAAISVSLGAGVNPYFVLRRTSPTTTDLSTGLFPVMNVNIALVLSLRTILADAVVPLSGTFDLQAGDVIGLFYEADGLTLSLNLGGNVAPGMQWTITKL